MAVRKKERNKNTDSGFVPIRRGIYEHINDGRMTGQEWMVYSILHLKADHQTGICYKVSAPALGMLLRIKPHTINRILRSLEKKGYIKRLSHIGQIVSYPVVINKFYCTLNGILIDAHKTKSLQEICWYVEKDCTLIVSQMYLKCTLNVPQMSCLQELKNITRPKEEPRPPKTPKEFSKDSTEYKLAKLLFDTIQQRKPDHKHPNLQEWAIHIDRMIRLDNRKPAQVTEVIRWCQADSGSGNGNWKGWQNNILSTESLRKQFDKLELSIQEEKPHTAVANLKRGPDGLTPRERLLGESK